MEIKIEGIIYGYEKTEVIAELNSLISVLKSIKFSQFGAYFSDYNSENFYIYKGCNHIAVHQKYNNGEVMDERLLFCQD